jgi:hypothetical protein
VSCMEIKLTSCYFGQTCPKVQHIEKYYNNNTSSVPWALVGLFKLFNNVTCKLFELIFSFQIFNFSKI